MFGKVGVDERGMAGSMPGPPRHADSSLAVFLHLDGLVLNESSSSRIQQLFENLRRISCVASALLDFNVNVSKHHVY